MAGTTKSLKGQLLLDSGELVGSFFAHTVVLICQHDAEGAFGLVLNHPTDKKFSEVIDTDLPEALRDQQLFVGGPVQPTAMSFLHSNADLTDANVMEGIHLLHSLDDLVSMAGNVSPSRRIKAFAGYAGWAPGQLEGEVRRKAWLAHPATIDLVFDSQPEDLWRRIVRSKGGWRNRLLSVTPENPSLN
jgi:putative transcriptional regulator